MHLGSSSLGGIPVSGSCPGVLRSQNGHETDKREWYQKMTLKQWQGIIRQIDDSLRILVPFQARDILPVAEEQSRTRGRQRSGITDQPQCRGM
jgi:hypothetical protein